MKVLELKGRHYEMGRQHARQVQDLRPQIAEVIGQRLQTLESYQTSLRPYVAELVAAWEEIARPTLDMLR
ncbi:MAG: hypothetical protein JSV81_09550, partial [Anaerolineales bacterium]